MWTAVSALGLGWTSRRAGRQARETRLASPPPNATVTPPSGCWLVVTLLLSFVFLPSGWAAEKIGFFDSQRLLAESTRLKTLRAELEGRWAAKDKEVEATQKALQDLVRASKDGADASNASNLPAGLARVRSAATPSPEKLAELKRLNETLDRLKREAMELRVKARDELRSRILADVREFARQQGYAAIFDRARAGVSYVGDEVDATAALIRWIDRPQ